MPERSWVPEALVDEISPPPRATPSDWVRRLPGDAYALDDENAPETPRLLHDGETVGFLWFEDHGRASFTVHADRDWSVDRQPPDGTTHFCALGDPETLGYSLKEFGDNMVDCDPTPQEIEIHYYAWAETPTTFIFRAGTFEAATETANTTPSMTVGPRAR